MRHEELLGFKYIAYFYTWGNVIWQPPSLFLSPSILYSFFLKKRTSHLFHMLLSFCWKYMGHHTLFRQENDSRDNNRAKRQFSIKKSFKSPRGRKLREFIRTPLRFPLTQMLVRGSRTQGEQKEMKKMSPHPQFYCFPFFLECWKLAGATNMTIKLQNA